MIARLAWSEEVLAEPSRAIDNGSRAMDDEVQPVDDGSYVEDLIACECRADRPFATL